MQPKIKISNARFATLNFQSEKNKIDACLQKLRVTN